jgi:hypothetical protein
MVQMGLLLLIGFQPLAASGSGPGADSLQSVSIRNQRLTVQADRAPLERLLEDVAAESGIEIFIQGHLEKATTVDFHGVNVELGLKRMLGGINHAFTYGYDSHGRVEVEQLFIYSASGEGEIRCIKKKARATLLAMPQTSIAPFGDGARIYPQTPDDMNPLASMRAIDPLMKINQAQAPYLPKDFHQHMGARFDESQPFVPGHEPNIKR